MLDWWQKREVERSLAQELHYAQEKLRLANMRLRDLAFAHSAATDPDLNFPAKQAQQSCERAFGQWKAALDRWTNFVKYGTVPQDIREKADNSEGFTNSSAD